MGTRHLICVVKDNEYKLAQYGQWDGYPEGQGVNILRFLRDFDRDVFEKNETMHPSGMTMERWNFPFKNLHERELVIKYNNRHIIFDDSNPF